MLHLGWELSEVYIGIIPISIEGFIVILIDIFLAEIGYLVGGKFF
jgi:hypothetical protein